MILLKYLCIIGNYQAQKKNMITIEVQIEQTSILWFS